MRALVVYYSLKGSTRRIAEAIAEMTDADLESLRTKDKIEASRFMDYYWGGKKKHPNEKVEIAPLEHDPSEYDMIFIGTPVWAWAPSPPVYSFLMDHSFKGKKVALFSSSEGELGKTFQKMEDLLEGNTIVSKEDFVDIGNDMDATCELKVREWAKNVLKQTFSN